MSQWLTQRAVLYLALLSTAGHLANCSHSAWLHNPGRVMLEKQGQTIEITPEHLVSVKWLVDGVVYSAQVQADGKDALVGVHITEANEQYLYLRSEEWNSLEDLPRDYLKLKEVQITASKGGRKPLVAIPTHQVKEVGIYKLIKPPVLSRFSKKDIATGALGGVSAVITGTHGSMEADEALAIMAIGATVGAVVYPAYKILNPQCERDLKPYPIDGLEEWKIEIVRE